MEGPNALLRCPKPFLSGTSLRLARHSRPAATQCRLSASRLSVVTRASFSTATTNPFHDELIATAKYISQRGRGILASDESNVTTGKRLATVGKEEVVAWQHEIGMSYVCWYACLYSVEG